MGIERRQGCDFWASYQDIQLGRSKHLLLKLSRNLIHKGVQSHGCQGGITIVIVFSLLSTSGSTDTERIIFTHKQIKLKKNQNKLQCNTSGSTNRCKNNKKKVPFKKKKKKKKKK